MNGKILLSDFCYAKNKNKLKHGRHESILDNAIDFNPFKPFWLAHPWQRQAQQSSGHWPLITLMTLEDGAENPRPGQYLCLLLAKRVFSWLYDTLVWNGSKLSLNIIKSTGSIKVWEVLYQLQITICYNSNNSIRILICRKFYHDISNLQVPKR